MEYDKGYVLLSGREGYALLSGRAGSTHAKSWCATKTLYLLSKKLLSWLKKTFGFKVALFRA